MIMLDSKQDIAEYITFKCWFASLTSLNSWRYHNCSYVLNYNFLTVLLQLHSPNYGLDLWKLLFMPHDNKRSGWRDGNIGGIGFNRLRNYAYGAEDLSSIVGISQQYAASHRSRVLPHYNSLSIFVYRHSNMIGDRGNGLVQPLWLGEDVAIGRDGE